MSAAVTDKFKKTYNSANPNVARVTSTRTAGGTSLACDNLAGWPTDTGVAFITYEINTNNEVIAGTQIDWVGIVSGNNIGTLTRVTGATDAGSAIGDVVEMTSTGSWANDVISGILTQHNQDGTHGAITSTNATLTTPKVITSLNDTNGNELFKVTATSSAVNELTVANAATGNGPTLSATGGDTNIDMNFSPKGTGKLKGVVDHLYNPYKFSVYRSAALTPAATGVLTCDTKEFDTGSNVDVVTNKGRFTAPVAGFYWFSAEVRFTATTSVQNFGISLNKNGSLAKEGNKFVNMFNGSTSIIACNVSAIIQLAASDYVEVKVLSDGTEALIIADGAANNYFQGALWSAA